MIIEELKSGKTASGQEIKAYKTHLKSKNYIYLVAGFYGDRVEGIFVLKKLFEWLKTNHEMHDLALIIVPILNWDGYEQGTATNALNVKLCSDFLDTQNLQSESLYLMKLFKKFPPKCFLNFNSGKPPVIHFSEGGKHAASFISKFNFYDLKSLEEKNSLVHFSNFLSKEYNSTFINLKFPKITDGLGLEDIWSHNEKALKELIIGDMFLK